ncbi:MAG: hypothetical protein ACTSXC_04765 [Candidatus Freyarchaeota archaeon]
MEFLVLASRYVRQPERERVVLQAVIEAAETVGAERVVRRRGNVYSIGVYVKNGTEKHLVYNDCDKNWNWRKIYDNMMASIRFSPRIRRENQIYLKA